MEATDFKNVVIENIPTALFKVAEVNFLDFIWTKIIDLVFMDFHLKFGYFLV